MTLRHPLDGNAIAADEYYERDDEEDLELDDEPDEDDYRQMKGRYEEWNQ